jgi:hypothetical protein
MKKEFTPYEQSLDLKELGFDEPCFGLYENGKLGYSFSTSQGIITPISYRTNSKFVEHILTKEDCTAPTFSQAFRWFREKYNLYACIERVEYIDSNEKGFQWYIFDKCSNVGEKLMSYEEAELECLKKLIEIVKENKL